MDRPKREDWITMKLTREGETLQRFNKVKEELGLKNNPEVIRHLIKVGYEQLVAKAK